VYLDVPKLTQEVTLFKNVELNLPQQIQLAKNASSIRWDESKFNASIVDLLRTRTYDDRGKQDLYTVFNTLHRILLMAMYEDEMNLEFYEDHEK
jgi:hypothetical protein